MPVATVNLEPEEKQDLKTCAGGFVVLKRMTYGQKLERTRYVSKLQVEMGRGRSTRGEMQVMQKASTLYDFKMCVVDHNLEDEKGNRLNLTTERDVDRLDPRIGEEISNMIDKLNNFEGEEGDEGNSETASERP